MDEMMTKKMNTDTAGMATNPSFHDHLHAHRSTRMLVIIFGVILVILVMLVVWWQFFHKANALFTPIQTLEQLKSTSQPVTATPQQRVTALSAARKSSKQYVVTPQKQLSILNALAK